VGLAFFVLWLTDAEFGRFLTGLVIEALAWL